MGTLYRHFATKDELIDAVLEDAFQEYLGLAEAALAVFALVPATRVFVGVAVAGYSVYYAIPLFLVFVITIARCIKAAVPAITEENRRKLVNSLLAAEIVMVAMIGIPRARAASIITSAA